MSLYRRRVLWAVLAVGVIAAGAYSYRLFQTHNANAVARTSPKTAQAVPVLVATVEEKAMPVRLSAIGTVQVVQSVTVRSRLDSQIMHVFVKDGQHVNAGQPLFELDSRQLEAQRQQAGAVLARDEAQLAFARRNLERKNPQISSEASIDEARTNLMALQANVQADRASLENLTVQLSYTKIAAPIPGRLGTIAYKLGNAVKTTDATPLVTINQIQPAYVAFSVPQSNLGRIQEAMSIGTVGAIATLPGTDLPPLQGRLAYLENAVDSSTSTISIKALFPNEQERLWPGAYVNVEVTLRTDPHAIVVPSQAVQTSQQGPYVFVTRDDNKVETRTVAVDRVIGDEAVIGQGLKPGERVVVEGQLRLVNGIQIVPKPFVAESTAGEAQPGEAQQAKTKSAADGKAAAKTKPSDRGTPAPKVSDGGNPASQAEARQ